jgi:hypothetical protein
MFFPLFLSAAAYNFIVVYKLRATLRILSETPSAARDRQRTTSFQKEFS